MSYNNFQKSLEFLFPSEGGYNNHKYDKGGPTNLGVTQYTYNSYRKRHGLPQKDIRQITKDEAIKIYYDDYLEDKRYNINSNNLFKLSVEKNNHIPEITFEDVNDSFNVKDLNISTPSIENPNQIPQNDMINYIFDQEMKNYRQNKLQTSQESFAPVQQDDNFNIYEI